MLIADWFFGRIIAVLVLAVTVSGSFSLVSYDFGCAFSFSVCGRTCSRTVSVMLKEISTAEFLSRLLLFIQDQCLREEVASLYKNCQMLRLIGLG